MKGKKRMGLRGAKAAARTGALRISRGTFVARRGWMGREAGKPAAETRRAELAMEAARTAALARVGEANDLADDSRAARRRRAAKERKKRG